MRHRIWAVTAVLVTVDTLAGDYLDDPLLADRAPPYHAIYLSNTIHGLDERAPYGESFDDGLDDLHGPEVAGWEAALARAQAAFPDAAIRAAEWPSPISAYRVIHLQQPGEWRNTGRSLVYIDGYEGYMDLRIDAQGLPWEERVFNALYPVHTARLGILYKVLATLTGAALAALGTLGLVSFARRFLG